MTIAQQNGTSRTISDNRASIRRAWLAMNQLSPRQGVTLGSGSAGSRQG